MLGALLVTALLRHEVAGSRPAERAESVPTAGFFDLNERIGTDPVVTPAQLAAIADPIARRAAALTLAADAGGESVSLDRISSLLPEAEGVNFRIHAIVNLGATDMPGAIAAAAALDEHEQRRLAFLRLAPVLAGVDPAGAIDLIDAVAAPDLATEAIDALFDAWALQAPAELMAWLEAGGASETPVPASAFALLAAGDPERLLETAADLRRGTAVLATTAALEALIETNPADTLAYFGALPPGNHLSMLGARAVEAYAEQDPEAAWAWALESEADAYTRMAVVRGVHQADPDAAWEIMQSMWTSPEPQMRAGVRDYMLNYVNIVTNSESTADIVTGLDRLLSLDDPVIASNLMTNLTMWADRDPEAALDWSLGNLDRINAAGMLTALSSALARTNPALARQTILRLEEKHQASWSAGVARQLAEADPGAAEAWAFEFPGGPLRDAGLSEVIFAQAQGGSVDRQLFDLINDDTTRGEAASRAARRFACDGQTTLALEIASAYITERRSLDLTRRFIEGDPNLGTASRTFECQFLR